MRVHEVHVGLEEAHDPVAQRARALEGPRERGALGLVVAVEDGLEEPLHGLEVVEDERLVDPGALRHVARAHPGVAALAEELLGRPEDRRPRLGARTSF